MPTPRVSVILPVFNAESTLPRAIGSMQSQTLADWELIVIDDGSTDDTRSAVLKQARHEPRLQPILGEHFGLVAALNQGLAHAKAPLIARMDADDIAHSERLAEQVAFLEAHRDIGLVGCLVAFGGDPESAGGYALHVDWLNTLVNPDEIALNRFVESPFAHPSVVFRRELSEQFGAYRSGDFPEDYELWLRWLEAGVRMAKVREVLLTWMDSPGRLSRCHPRYDVEAFYRCKAAYLARWLQRNVAPDRKLLVWGAGRPTRKRAQLLVEHGIQISGYIDIDPKKIGRVFSGRSVICPGDLPPPADCFVLCYVAKRGARDLARAYLRKQGFMEGIDFLAVA
jgi:glycosyltransferase involved in cell wall biosynthesis